MADNKQIVGRIFEEVWNQGRIDQVPKLLASSFQGYIPLVGKLDRSSFPAAVGAFRKAFPDLHFDLQDIVQEGDKVVAYWIATGTSRGDFMGLKATGKTQSVHGFTYFQIENGVVAREHSEYDVALMLQGLGISLPPAGMAAAQPQSQPQARQ